MKIYLATPMADTSSKEWRASEEKLKSNEFLKNTLEKAGHSVVLPQEFSNLSAEEIFIAEIEAIKNADALVAVLSDTRGVYCETGFAYALNKPIYALEVEGMRPVSDWGRNWFVSVSKSVEELLRSLE